jgi:hypothetical protein
LANVKETQLKKLARGLFVKIISLRENTRKGRRSKLKSMYKFRRLLKQKAMIRIEIMILAFEVNH